MNNVSEFFTWRMVATFTGCMTAVGIIVQFLKNVKFLAKLPSQLVAYLVALILLYASYFFTGVLNASSACLIPFNAIAVCAGAMGVYDVVKLATVSAIDKQKPKA